MARTRAWGIFSTVAMVAALFFVASGCTILSRNTIQQKPPTVPSPQGGSVAVFSSDIAVYQPMSNDEVGETFTVSGQAVYGVALVVVLVQDDSSLAFATATLSVSNGYFSGLVKIIDPPTRTGTVIVVARLTDGTVGSQISVPISFTTYRGRVVSLFFSNVIKDPELKNCGQVYPVSREIKVTPSIEHNALVREMAGPTDVEVNQGYLTNFPDQGVTLGNIKLTNNIYTVDFKITPQVKMGSCQAYALRAQVEQTLEQFATSSRVIITINGKPGIL